MKWNQGVLGLVAAATLVYAPTFLPAQGQYQNNWGYNDDRGSGRWEAPPQEYRGIGRRGFQDGMEGAWRDFENHRRPDVRNRDEFRHPRVPDPLKHEYREAFNRGYQVGVEHIMNSYSGQRPYGWRAR